MPVLAASSPSDCFQLTVEAFRFAVRAMSPVILLSDGYLGNSSEPWLIPDPDAMEPIEVVHPVQQDGVTFQPYARDEHTLARPWALPGTAGLEHRLGGLAKAPLTGNVSYKPEHHAQMVRDRQEKVDRLADLVPPQEVYGDESGELLLLGWGSTYGAIRAAVTRARNEGIAVSSTHLRYIAPMPTNLEEVFSRFKKVVIIEMNGGQMAFYLQGKFARPFESLTQVTGRPFKIETIYQAIRKALVREG